MRLSISFQQNRTHNKNYLLLLIICLLAYWPLTFGIFSVKNDAIHYFLPYRFQISETLRNGEFPFWNPYIYLGYPVHGDMQSGAWNPIVWFFSFFSRYNITLFHTENLLYIFLSGIGMYKLTARLTSHTYTALFIAISYMLSGFMLSGQLINWLAAAAFLPFVIRYYLQTLQSPRFSNSVKTAIALYFLFVAGYPSFFIITGYILLLLFILTTVSRIRTKKELSVKWNRFILQHLLITIIFTGLALPAIISFYDLLPYYQRGNGATYNDVIQNSFELQHLLSFIFPSSIKTNQLVSATDVTCRNVYIGLFALIILISFPPKLNRRNILLILLVLFALLFSLGDASPIRKICYQLIPFMNTFRHPSQMRLFFIFGILLLVAPGLKRFLSTDLSVKNKRWINIVTLSTIIVVLLVTIIMLPGSAFLKSLFHLQAAETRTDLKNIFDNLNFADAVTINGLLQLAFLTAFLLLFRKPFLNKKIFFCLWVANLFIMAQLVLPSTFVSKVSPKEINAIIRSSPKGFPVTGLEKSIAQNSKDATINFDKIALSYFYNKKIGISHSTNSPSFLTEQEKFLQDSFLYNYVASLPVAYIARQTLSIDDSLSALLSTTCHSAFTASATGKKDSCTGIDNVIIKKISANSFEIETQTSDSSLLVLTQNYHHNWRAKVDNNPVSITKTNISFMSILVPAGKHHVIFQFSPPAVIRAMWVMLATIILLIIAGTVSSIRKTPLSTLH